MVAVVFDILLCNRLQRFTLDEQPFETTDLCQVDNEHAHLKNNKSDFSHFTTGVYARLENLIWKGLFTESLKGSVAF